MEETDIITFNGEVGVFSDEVVEILINGNFNRFSFISQAHLTLMSNKKSAAQFLAEYAKKDENIIISFPTASTFIPHSFKVFFVRAQNNQIDASQYDCVVILDGKKTSAEVAERITIAYGYWNLGRTPEKIIV